MSPPVSLPPKRDRAAERRKQSARILRHGTETMAPCSNCQKSGSLCKMLQGHARCATCTKKNLRCDGQFSEDEYDLLDKKKQELQEKVRSSQRRVSDRAQWYAREMARLASQQSEEMMSEQRSLALM